MLLYPEYQIGGVKPSPDLELNMEWNQLVRDIFEDCGLDKTWGEAGIAGTPPLPLYFPVKI
jgi:hypothetical protein